MLPKKFRLTFTQFNNLFGSYKEIKSAFFTIRLKTQTDYPRPRFVVVTPKALDKRSTKRHFTKRIVLEEIYKQVKKINKPVGVLIKPKKLINTKNKNIMIKDLLFLFHIAELT